MGLLELFILAIGLSMDAFAVSICKGLALPKINLKSAGIVGLWFGVFQALMPLIGYLLGVNFRSYIVSIDHWIAFVLLALIGANMIKEALSDDDEEEEAEIRNLKRGPEEGTIGVCSLDSCSISPTGQVALSRADNRIKEILGFKTMFLLAVATSIDALAMGVTFAFLNVNIIPAISFIGVVTFTCSAIGVKIGNVFGLKYKSKAEIAGGVILILLGCKILIEHLGIL
ncbi:manganese efflux pump MntP family protein [Intestinibacter bartlettii]|uniref:manganese efflux pump MntP n=1 Tax=Intestinibacter bartlettii TaxID=261299 RepID=UPI0039F641BF